MVLFQSAPVLLETKLKKHHTDSHGHRVIQMEKTARGEVESKEKKYFKAKYQM